MPKPFIHWDPSLNAALYVKQGGGPLVVDADINPEQFDFLVSKFCRAVTFGGDLSVDFIQTMRTVSGAAPKSGLRVRAFSYMPQGMEFYNDGGVSGEPFPQSEDDTNTIVYCSLGWRASIRGYLGTRHNTNYASDLQVSWADRDVRSSAQVRGGYTGAILRNWATAPGFAEGTYDWLACLHGKRSVDSNWQYNSFTGGLSGVPDVSSTTVLNGIDNDKLRIIIQGGAPDSDVTWQRFNGASWDDLFTASVTLDFGPSALWPYQAITADLFAGNVLVQPPIVGGTWPDAETWFSRIEMTQFEPFILDKSSWGYREWEDHWAWLITGSEYLIERRLPQRDLMHVTPGVPGSPTSLRASDSDLGICMEFNEFTYLIAMSSWDESGSKTTNNEKPCVMDEDEYGYRAPFCMLGRFKFQKMAQWSQALPVDLFFAGKSWENSSSIGIYWEYTGGIGEGKLVLRAWDDVASGFVFVEYPFNASDYDETPVDVGFTWSGARGASIGRSNYELRLVVDGRTVGLLVNTNIRVSGSDNLWVGSPRGAGTVGDRRSFSGVFREMMVFADAMTDADMINAWRDTPAIDNPSFEQPATTSRPGEADGWTWVSEQLAGGWAGFNEYRVPLLEWATSFEHFSAGWHMPHIWAYPDEASRTGVTGLTASDVDGIAWQMDEDSLWKLTNHSPVTWEAVDIGTNEGWLDNIDDFLAALFNAGIPLHETLIEEFGIWDFSVEAGEPIGTIILPPWTEKTTVAPHDDTLNNASGGTIPIDLPTGFRGWKDAVTGAMEYPLSTDEFGEGWDTDPLSTAGGPVWIPGSAADGKLRGRALTFPVTIVPDRRFLIIWSDNSQVNILELDTGDYADVASLLSMLNTKLQAQIGVDTGWDFTAWDDGTDQGILFGWNNDTSALFSYMGMFAKSSSFPHNDARLDIGLDALGPGGIEGKVIMPAREVMFLPAGVDIDDEFWLDPWSMVMFTMIEDLYIDLVILDYHSDPAIFGQFDSPPDPTVIERFTLIGWFGAGSAWIPTWSGTAAMFDTGSTDSEQFEPSEWPDYV